MTEGIETPKICNMLHILMILARPSLIMMHVEERLKCDKDLKFSVYIIKTDQFLMINHLCEYNHAEI